jgi:hypothetical protein
MRMSCATLSMVSDLDREPFDLMDYPDELSNFGDPLFPTDDQAAATTVTPTDLDILGGRGGAVNIHPGNKRYMELIRHQAEKYGNAADDQKNPLAKSIVQMLQGEGRRFLVPVGQDGGAVSYAEALESDSIKKTQTALRSEIKKRQTRAASQRGLKKQQGNDRTRPATPAESWLHVVPPSPTPSVFREAKHLPFVPNTPRRVLEISVLSQKAQQSLPQPDPGFRWVLQQLPMESVAVTEV